MKEHNVTSEQQTAFIPTANETAADNAATPAPLDRSSEEWRRQFGALPSFCGQSSTLRPIPRHVQAPAAGVGAVETPAKTNPFSFLAALVGIVLVGGLIVYGYFPSPQAAPQKKIEKSSGNVVTASGEKQRKIARNALSRTGASETVSAVSLSIPPAKKAEKKEVTSARESRRAVQTSPPARPALDRTSNARNQKINSPVPVRAALNKAAISVRAPTAAVPLSTTPKAAVQARPAPSAQPLPKAAPPVPKTAEPEGTNPLGLPL